MLLRISYFQKRYSFCVNECAILNLGFLHSFSIVPSPSSVPKIRLFCSLAKPLPTVLSYHVWVTSDRTSPLLVALLKLDYSSFRPISKPTSRCRAMPSIWTLGHHQPVIHGVAFIRYLRPFYKVS